MIISVKYTYSEDLEIVYRCQRILVKVISLRAGDILVTIDREIKIEDCTGIIDFDVHRTPCKYILVI